MPYFLLSQKYKLDEETWSIYVLQKPMGKFKPNLAGIVVGWSSF
jgi:hypothetical protein